MTHVREGAVTGGGNLLLLFIYFVYIYLLGLYFGLIHI